MKDLFFSATGRITRAAFWLGSIGATIVLALVLAVALVVLWQLIPGQIDENGGVSVHGLVALPYFSVVLAYLVAQIWAGLCLGIKRYHDLDKPGTWMLLLLIPGIGGLIYLIQAGFTPGTQGANRYGPDPLLI